MSVCYNGGEIENTVLRSVVIMLKTDKHLENAIPDYRHYFKGVKNTKGIGWKIIKALFKENKKAFITTVLFFLIKQSPVYLIPLVLAQIVDIVTYPDVHNITEIYIYGAILLVFIIQNIPTHTLYVKHKSKMLRSISAGLRNTMVKKLHQISLTYHKELQSGKLQSKFVRDMECIELFLERIMESLIPTIFTLVITIAISITKSWIVTAAFVIMVPMTVVLRKIFQKKMRKATSSLRKESENLTSDISEMIELMPVTKAHGLEIEESSKVEEGIKRLRRVGYNVDMTNALFGSTSWVVVQSMSALCLIFTGALAYGGLITVGAVVLFHSYFSTIAGNVQNLLAIYPELLKGTESLKSISEILISNKIENNDKKIKLRHLHGSIQFKNVSYKYPGSDKIIINNLSLDVKPGECVAFVGSSGSGKSTVMNMIIGFLRSTNGTLLIDGKPIEYLDLTSYRQFISVVPQNCIMFSGTIRDNILYGMHDVSEEKLQKVLEQANITEFINQLPKGIDTPVAEHGGNLSGGQKQRISIARALIRDPQIIILDEATSALDNISEYHVQQAMNELIKGRTTFIVAHRLSTIRDANKIVVLEQGKMVECGTFDELMNKKGKFYELKQLSELTGGTNE